MAKPIAYFGYSKQGLTVTFQNLSTNSPTDFVWDFGDGNSSVQKNPSHTYNEMGFFTVKLIATNSDGESEVSITIGNSDVNDSLNVSIIELVDHYMPTALTGELSATEKIALIMKWQLYLQPLVLVPYRVEESDTHNELKWPGLVNSLIAQLVSYDVILEGANQFLSGSGSAWENETDPDDPTAPKEGPIKAIETGPARAEWYEGVDVSEAIKNIGSAYSSALKAGGALDSLRQSICQQSARVRIYLPMCGQLSYSPVIPIVSKKYRGGHNANPFGITKRMT
jgi:PKD repeat protein